MSEMPDMKACEGFLEAEIDRLTRAIYDLELKKAMYERIRELSRASTCTTPEMSDSDSSDDELLMPNGFVDVGADLVDVDFKEAEASPPRKKSRKNKKKSPTNESLSEISAPAPLPVPDPIFVVDDDSNDVINFSAGGWKSRQTRRNAKSTFCETVPRKSRRIASRDSSFSADLDESDIHVVEDSPKDIFDDSLINHSSFSFDQDVEDVPPEPVEDPNAEVRIRVIWKGSSTQHFTLRKFQKIKEIFTHYAQMEGVEEGRILFSLRDKTVSPNDTPQSLNIGVSSLEGGIIDAVNVATRSTNNADEQAEEDPNALKLSIQRKGIKEKHTVFTYPHEKISVLMSKLSEQLNIPYSSIKLMFDGEQLSPDSTPEDNEIEGDECIDLVVTQ